jgi:hypothetical protein
VEPRALAGSAESLAVPVAPPLVAAVPLNYAVVRQRLKVPGAVSSFWQAPQSQRPTKPVVVFRPQVAQE